MTSNHDEYGNDITLEHLNCSTKQEVVHIFSEKVRKELALR